MSQIIKSILPTVIAPLIVRNGASRQTSNYEQVLKVQDLVRPTEVNDTQGMPLAVLGGKPFWPDFSVPDGAFKTKHRGCVGFAQSFCRGRMRHVYRALFVVISAAALAAAWAPTPSQSQPQAAAQGQAAGSASGLPVPSRASA